MIGYVTDSFTFVTLDGSFFWMLLSDTRAMGPVLGVVWYDLSVTKAKGSVTYPFAIISSDQNMVNIHTCVFFFLVLCGS